MSQPNRASNDDYASHPWVESLSAVEGNYMSKVSQRKRGSRLTWRRIALCLGIVIMSSAAAFGQLTTGTIGGSVTDQTGAAMPGVMVTLKHTETGVTRTTITNETGRYDALSLPTGTYEI